MTQGIPDDDRIHHRRPRKTGIAEGLTHADVLSAIDRWRVLGREQFMASFGANAAQKYIVVDGADEIDAMALLRGARALRGLDFAADYRGDRRNVADPLRALGFFVDNLHSDTEAPLGNDPSAYSRPLPEFERDTDALTIGSYRREQRILRGALGIGTGDGDRLHECGICGRPRPERLLVAAHIKRRSECTESERRDLGSIAMPACTLGCDALYENGYLSVASGGRILVFESDGVALGFFHGRLAPAWSTQREPYFGWHRKYLFRGSPRVMSSS